jgi:hypothetical protein
MSLFLLPLALSLGTTTTCLDKLNELCARQGPARSVEACKVCIFDNADKLSAANCSHADEDVYCNAPLPPPPPPTPRMASIPHDVAAFAASQGKSLVANLSKAVCCTKMDDVVHHCSYPDDEWSILPQCADRLKEAIAHGDKYRTCYPQVPEWADYRGDFPRPGRVLKPCDRCGECMPYTTSGEWDLRIQAVAKFCASDGTRSITVAFTDPECTKPLGKTPGPADAPGRAGPYPAWDVWGVVTTPTSEYPDFAQKCGQDYHCSKEEPQGHCEGECLDFVYPKCEHRVYPYCHPPHCTCHAVHTPTPETVRAGGIEFQSIVDV